MAVCYRHPDRTTGVTCNRCGEFICPDCMINAPVGFQCPNCAAVSNPRGTRPVTNRTMGSGLTGLPPVTRWILFACVGLYLYGFLLGRSDELAVKYGMFPIGIAEGQWWRLLTATFLHAGLLHILFNMYALYILGPGLERYLGSKRFASLYFLSALGGSAASFWFSNPSTLAVGASGAIFGLLTATIVIGQHLRNDVSQLIVLLIINAVIGFSGGIDWRAHFGGAIVGASVAAIFVKDSNTASRKLQNVGVFLIFIGLFVLIVMRNQQLIAQFNL